MRLVRRLGGILVLAATAAIATLVVVACAKGTETGGDFGEGGVEVDASRDVNVVPIPKDSGPADDTGTMPGDDSGSCSKKVVINEVKTAGASPNDEMIELYNPSTCAVPLGNWELKYQSGSGGAGLAGHKFAVGDSIPSKGFLVLTPGGSTDWTAGMSGSDGQVGLLDDTAKLVDGVGYGTVTGGSYKEGTAAPSPPTSGSIGRSPSGVDTGNNKTDWKTYTTPSPGIANP